MSDDTGLIVQDIHTVEHGPNTGEGEPGHVSVNGISLRSYNEMLVKGRGLPILCPEPPQHAPKDDPEVFAACEMLKAALGYSDDIAAISDEEKAFYDWFLFRPTRFAVIPRGLNLLVADGYYNRGNVYLNDLRQQFDVPIPATGHALMDDALLAALNASYARSAVQTIYAICFARWAKQMVNPDFIEKSATTAGKTKGDGRANRMNNVLRWALEMIGGQAITDLFHAPPPALTPPAQG